jgi:hypothetical protein
VLGPAEGGSMVYLSVAGTATDIRNSPLADRMYD